MPRSDGPFKVLERVGENAYKVDLGDKYGVSSTFNVGDLAHYLEDEELEDLRANPFQEEGNDAGAQDLVQVFKVDPIAIDYSHVEKGLNQANLFGLGLAWNVQDYSLVSWDGLGSN